MFGVIINGASQIAGSVSVEGILQVNPGTGDTSQTITAGHRAYVPSSYEVANGQSLTIADTAILEVG